MVASGISGGLTCAFVLFNFGAELLSQRLGIEVQNNEWTRKNREAGRPFIEHRLEIMDFYLQTEFIASPNVWTTAWINK